MKEFCKDIDLNKSYVIIPRPLGIEFTAKYASGTLVSAITFGDGCSGEDITSYLVEANLIPKKLTSFASMELRGVATIRHSGEKSIYSKVPYYLVKDKDHAKLIDIFIYGTFKFDPETISSDYKTQRVYLKKLGFRMIPETILRGSDLQPYSSNADRLFDLNFAEDFRECREAYLFDQNLPVGRKNPFEWNLINAESEGIRVNFTDLTFTPNHKGIAGVEIYSVSSPRKRFTIKLDDTLLLTEKKLNRGAMVMMAKDKEDNFIIKDVIDPGTESRPHCSSCEHDLRLIGGYYACINHKCHGIKTAQIKKFYSDLKIDISDISDDSLHALFRYSFHPIDILEVEDSRLARKGFPVHFKDNLRSQLLNCPLDLLLRTLNVNKAFAKTGELKYNWDLEFMSFSNSAVYVLGILKNMGHPALRDIYIPTEV